jgi:hypothetical protein
MMNRSGRCCESRLSCLPSGTVPIVLVIEWLARKAGRLAAGEQVMLAGGGCLGSAPVVVCLDAGMRQGQAAVRCRSIAGTVVSIASLTVTGGPVARRVSPRAGSRAPGCACCRGWRGGTWVTGMFAGT